MRASEVNTTELRTFLELQGIHLPWGTARDKLVRVLEKLEEAKKQSYGPTRIDLHRYAILWWAAREWRRIYIQVTCPLIGEGCFTCTDFRVVGCLTSNRRVFDTGKEEVEMSIWGKILSTVVGGELAKAAPLLRSAAAEELPDVPATRTAIYKTAQALIDRLAGKVRRFAEYPKLALTAEALPEAFAFMTNKSPNQALTVLADMCEGRVTPGPTVGIPPVAPEPAVSTPSAAAALPPVRTAPSAAEAYFPGVEETGAPPVAAPSSRGPDAEVFFDTAPEAAPASPPPPAAVAPPVTPPPAVSSPPKAAPPAPLAPPPDPAPAPPAAESFSSATELLKAIPEPSHPSADAIIALSDVLERQEALLMHQANQLVHEANTLKALGSTLKKIANGLAGPGKTKRAARGNGKDVQTPLPFVPPTAPVSAPAACLPDDEPDDPEDPFRDEEGTDMG